MTRRTATCPNCGASIEFLWSSAVQTTCSFCKSILVRHDVDLEKVGVVGDLPPEVSPIRIGTEGIYRGTPFTVVGRILYAYERGGWNEWHLRLADDSSAWLSDAQMEYAVTREATSSAPLPDASAVRVGAAYEIGGERFRVTSITRARYRGVEGELPFTYYDKAEVPFADLESSGQRFATLDYSDGPEDPVAYVGEYQDFDALHFSNLREIAGW